MDFVDEKHIALVEVGQQTGKVGRLLDGWAAGYLELAPHFARKYSGEGGLAEAWRAAEENVVEGIAPLLGRLYGDIEPLLDLGLAGELGKRTRPERPVQGGIRLGQHVGNHPIGHAGHRLRQTAAQPKAIQFMKKKGVKNLPEHPVLGSMRGA